MFQQKVPKMNNKNVRQKCFIVLYKQNISFQLVCNSPLGPYSEEIYILPKPPPRSPPTPPGNPPKSPLKHDLGGLLPTLGGGW